MPEVAERRKISIVQNSTSKFNTPKTYKSLNKLHTPALKLTGWIVNEAGRNVALSYSEPLFHASKYEIIINDGLGFTAIVSGFSLSDNHVL